MPDETATDEHWNLTIFLIILTCFISIAAGMYFTSFNIPSCKIWDSNRSYDKILLFDTVVCVPANEVNTTYYHYEIAEYNNTQYIMNKVRIDNTSAKRLVVCK